ncbi:MAG: hypothetical protein HFG64_07715, partial [Lachnospiraceae bacterium]|nr:hypothetical protein [Lachnospiraceae bacterium]
MKDFIFSNDFSRNIDAMIYTCGYENCTPGHSYGPVLRNGYLIHYVLSGCGIYKARGKLFRLKEGDAFLICPGELIYYEADHKHPWTYTWIGMQGIKIQGYLERTCLLEKLVFHYGRDDQIRLCHEKMFEADKLPCNRDLIMNQCHLDNFIITGFLDAAGICGPPLLRNQRFRIFFCMANKQICICFKK